MKTIVTLSVFLLSIMAIAQSNAPVTVVTVPSGHNLINASGKDIVLVVGTRTFPDGSMLPFGHDSLTKHAVLSAGMSHSDTEPAGDTVPVLKVTFVQYLDGSTWGNTASNEAQWVLKKRTAALNFLAAMANASSTDDFQYKLNHYPPCPNVTFTQGNINSLGVDQAWQIIKTRFNIAQSRTSLWSY